VKDVEFRDPFALLFQDFQPIAAIATTPAGVQQLQRLSELNTLWVPAAIASDIQLPSSTHTIHAYPGSLKTHLESLWSSHRSLVFCLATGAVVRLIAPFLTDKATDPAVVVIDQAGQVVISLCGGHQGQADQLTRLIAHQLGATPILTGAANHLNLPGLDILGVPFGWSKGNGDWTSVSAAIARQDPIEVIQDAGSSLWQQHLPAGHPFQFQPADCQPYARIWISAVDHGLDPSPNPIPTVHWHPRVLWIGIGCERGTARVVIEQAVEEVLQRHHLAGGAIAGIATIDLKADEPGLLEFCRDRALPFQCFSAARLSAVAVPNPSSIVAAEVGTPSVAEAAALVGASLASGLGDGSESLPLLRVAKQILRVDGQPGAVTIAVAQAEQEYIGRNGSLWLVGTGPGALEQITPAAQTAIAQADVVIGYSLYIDLVQPLLRPGQIVQAFPITQERQRAERAIALATWGLTIAVISSGDCGIYGMAGLVLEQLRSQGWDGNVPAVQVFPGITALQAAASRVGAPLMHDFCAISLSDLLTPWSVIETRLIAAAQADFVVALYNPKSQTRTEQIAIAQTIFLRHRHPNTPVALVRAAYRSDEQITVTTLAELPLAAIDMLTTVLIGNQSTRTYGDWMITPRGYLGFASPLGDVQIS